MLNINWDAVEKLRKENKVRFEILKKRLKELGIDVNKKPYMELDDLYCNLPEQTAGLSFEDININEIVLMDLKWEARTSGCLVKANEIFVHTFLED